MPPRDFVWSRVWAMHRNVPRLHTRGVQSLTPEDDAKGGCTSHKAGNVLQHTIHPAHHAPALAVPRSNLFATMQHTQQPPVLHGHTGRLDCVWVAHAVAPHPASLSMMALRFVPHLPTARSARLSSTGTFCLRPSDTTASQSDHGNPSLARRPYYRSHKPTAVDAHRPHRAAPLWDVALGQVLT